MHIERISNNCFPFDRKPASILATTALAVAVAGAVLAIVAWQLQWGVPAISTCAAIGVTAIVFLAIALCTCKKQSEQRGIDNLPRSHTNESGPDPLVHQLKNRGEQLWTSVIDKDLKSFKETLKLYSPFEFATLYGNETLFGSLFSEIMATNSEPFLQAFLEKMPDGNFFIAHEYFFQITDTKLIDLILRKLDPSALRATLRCYLSSGKYPTVWLNKLMPHYSKVMQPFEDAKMMVQICASQLDHTHKISTLHAIAQQRQKPLQDMRFEKIPCKSDLNPENGHVLHIAIEAQDTKIIEYIVTTFPYLANTSAKYDQTPLIHAILTGNVESVKLLLENTASADHIILQPEKLPLNLWKYRHKPSVMTPLMIAASLGHEAIVNALLPYSEPARTDKNPTQAWTYLDYLAANKKYFG